MGLYAFRKLTYVVIYAPFPAEEIMKMFIPVSRRNAKAKYVTYLQIPSPKSSVNTLDTSLNDSNKFFVLD